MATASGIVELMDLKLAYLLEIWEGIKQAMERRAER